MLKTAVGVGPDACSRHNSQDLGGPLQCFATATAAVEGFFPFHLMTDPWLALALAVALGLGLALGCLDAWMLGCLDVLSTHGTSGIKSPAHVRFGALSPTVAKGEASRSSREGRGGQATGGSLAEPLGLGQAKTTHYYSTKYSHTTGKHTGILEPWHPGILASWHPGILERNA